jgi:hypothetical protein
MGQTGAEFGAVSTAGLMQRVRRKVDDTRAKIDKAPYTTKGRKARANIALDGLLAYLEAEYAQVLAGTKAEEPFRQKLISALDPGMSGGSQRPRIRW